MGGWESAKEGDSKVIPGETLEWGRVLSCKELTERREVSAQIIPPCHFCFRKPPDG